MEPKHTTLELTVNPEYVQSWGVWEGVRELLQNCQDGADKGYPATIKYDEEAHKLQLINKGVTLDRSCLLLGTTTKRDDEDQRGYFGEGLKLSWLVLLRNDYQIKIKNGEETWKPCLGRSEKFGATLLKVKVTPARPKKIYKCEIVGLTPSTWDAIKELCLFLTPPKKEEQICVDKCRILLGEKYRGKLFVKGIFITNLSDEHQYGYDLWDVEVDRDRHLADPVGLRMAIRKLLKKATLAGLLSQAEVFDLINSKYSESRYFEYDYSATDDFYSLLVKEFRQRHGEDACPVTTNGEAHNVSHFGMTGVILERGLVEALSKELGSTQNIITIKGNPIKSVYKLSELEGTIQDNLTWAIKMVNYGDNTCNLQNVQIVEYNDPKLLGTYQKLEYGYQISLAKHLVERSRKALLPVLVHEVAHQYGPDGSTEHHTAINNIFTHIVLSLS